MRSLRVITGPMFAGKTGRLAYYLDRSKRAGLRGALLVPAADTRKTRRLDAACPTHVIKPDMSPDCVVTALAMEHVNTVAIDEVQFIAPWTAGFIDRLFAVAQNIRVIVAGLDMDCEGIPWPGMGDLLARADAVEKLTGICMYCGSEHGTMTLDTAPQAHKRNAINPGDFTDGYRVACRDCWDRQRAAHSMGKDAA